MSMPPCVSAPPSSAPSESDEPASSKALRGVGDKRSWYSSSLAAGGMASVDDVVMGERPPSSVPSSARVCSSSGGGRTWVYAPAS